MDPPSYQSISRPEAANKAFENRLKIIVGLDYGTTNSGNWLLQDQYRHLLLKQIP